MKILKYFAETTITTNDINLPNENTGFSPDKVTLILQVVFGLAGAIALLVIVIAGLRMVLSQGDPKRVQDSRNAILYALIGLAIAILSFTIVSFVLNRV